ncbi:hypothetical protein [Kribbia dieselivorans]|uniref:hypothetical protein n=1 Tax=Kribbia dieselivorans TaxID=331526 RepID=UPI000838754A|nr:hypothetical protein [Kribbia dieselivorans]
MSKVNPIQARRGDVDGSLGEFDQAAGAKERLAAARALREAAEALEYATVLQARHDGMSWSKIGAIYGLTKQGAQQRFREKPSTAGSEAGEPTA